MAYGTQYVVFVSISSILDTIIVKLHACISCIPHPYYVMLISARLQNKLLRHAATRMSAVSLFSLSLPPPGYRLSLYLSRLVNAMAAQGD